MVIDDSRTIRMILSSTLAELGYQVSEAGNGKEALSAVEREDDGFALFLVDWNMPEMNGLDALIAIRNEFPEARIIVLTTYSGDVQVLRALKAGAAAFFQKPADNDELMNVIRVSIGPGQEQRAPWPS